MDVSRRVRWRLPLGHPRKAIRLSFPDFLVARLDSLGVKWVLVELESPTAPLFTKDRRESRQLAKGISQINEWRRWLDDNRTYARRAGRSGLGLKDIASDSP
ncbi:MAG: Shedu anti-phage system protein SduA domain-containing protein, partial [Pseudomonas sp.]